MREHRDLRTSFHFQSPPTRRRETRTILSPKKPKKEAPCSPKFQTKPGNTHKQCHLEPNVNCTPPWPAVENLDVCLPSFHLVHDHPTPRPIFHIQRKKRCRHAPPFFRILFSTPCRFFCIRASPLPCDQPDGLRRYSRIRIQKETCAAPFLRLHLVRTGAGPPQTRQAPQSAPPSSTPS